MPRNSQRCILVDSLRSYLTVSRKLEMLAPDGLNFVIHRRITKQLSKKKVKKLYGRCGNLCKKKMNVSFSQLFIVLC